MSPIDYSKYPKNWNELRESILLRAYNCCELCFVPNKFYVIRRKRSGLIFFKSGIEREAIAEYERSKSLDLRKPVQIVLTIAHINQDIKDNRKCNLMTSLT